MNDREITIDIGDPESIKKAIAEVEKYEKWLEEKTEIFIKKLAEKGVAIADRRFGNTETDGQKGNIAVYARKTADGYEVCADGDEVLFIEFGTGVTYPDNYPNKPAEIAGRGTYGKGHGKRRTWAFYSDEQPGAYGWNPKGTEGLIATHGMPAQMPMYLTAKEVARIAEETAREVFR